MPGGGNAILGQEAGCRKTLFELEGKYYDNVKEGDLPEELYGILKLSGERG